MRSCKDGKSNVASHQQQSLGAEFVVADIRHAKLLGESTENARQLIDGINDWCA
jgi:hypothetical protein